MATRKKDVFIGTEKAYTPHSSRLSGWLKGGRNLRINPFTVDEDHIAIGEKWDEWLDELEREMRFFRIKDPEDKKDAMLIYGGAEISKLEKSLQDPTDGDVYAKLKGKWTDYVASKKTYIMRDIFFLR